MARIYSIDYSHEHAAPFGVYRIVPADVCSTGRVWLASFATRALAASWIDSRK